ncbi:MAG: nucleotidyl transferase AbiEii/AbiGii toxin family protein [Spirochaetaceae bacterium]|nr:nucleotidyl transferase AbiEii/AbiGii toxin family protein [Spirochaetaceae bacterium]MDE0219258.1 nucleotidyl transferase AbiEii/AbiGii toxin family protein [Spirochaetaceae bacterium]
MKSLLMDLLADEPDAFQGRSTAREYLQARILLALQDHGSFTDWAFVGGTALRFLYRLPRYSEDLDFSLLAAGRDARFESLMRSVRHDLTAEGYEVEIQSRARGAVTIGMVKFGRLLYEAGLSPHASQVLAIRVEIDTNPPAGADCDTSVVRTFGMLNLLHHDRASLFAGKLHAVLMRAYTKGRDLYDLAWYLSDPEWPAPNLRLLNSALRQTGWAGAPATPATWRELVADKLQSIDWSVARNDVSPFLERRQDADLVDRDVLLGLLGQRRES